MDRPEQTPTDQPEALEGIEGHREQECSKQPLCSTAQSRDLRCRHNADWRRPQRTSASYDTEIHSRRLLCRRAERWRLTRLGERAR